MLEIHKVQALTKNGGFSPTHLKNMLMLVKLDHETPRIEVKIELPPPHLTTGGMFGCCLHRWSFVFFWGSALGASQGATRVQSVGEAADLRNGGCQRVWEM